MKISSCVVVLFLIGTKCYGASTGGQVVQTKVLILGAGVSGITAAKTLYDNGEMDFLVLEGQDYIGGRIKQHDFQGFKIEEGANWVQNLTEENPLYDIMMEYSFQGIYSNYEDAIARNSSGDNITDQKVVKRYEEVLEKLEELAYTYDESDDISVKEALRRVGWVAKTQMEKAIERFTIDFEFAMPSNKTSFSAFGVYEGDDYFVVDPRGYNMFVLGMSDFFKEKILLTKTVTSINWSTSNVRVTTTDGSIFEAKYVLSTFSNNVLLSDMVKFDPPLPRSKVDSLRKVPVANYTKIFLKFPYKFWDDREFILFGWDADGGYYHTWQDLERPGILPAGSGMLLMTCTDVVSERIESQPEWETLNEVMGILRGVYGQDIPDAEDIFYGRWSQNPYVRGAYSNAIVGATTSDFDNIASNLGRLFFSGEGTTYDYFGYVHGGLLTGKWKGENILDCIANKPECPIQHE